ncbi:hypothetical protein [Streptomyces sp. NPDC096339]|uniref:hypothetical protein n=1 Tax=Streptomyces sp. NPDC096339 TaxID=3366086 RepID=UPI003816582E
MTALHDITATAPVWAGDSQYYLYGTEFDPTGFTYTGFNGLLAPLRPGTGIGVPGTFAVILTGLETGYVTVTLELHPTSPPAPVLDDWDEVVEASLELPDGDAYIFDAHDATPFPSLAAYTGRPTRIRVHARGRDAARNATEPDDEHPLEQHLIQLWPAPVAELISHKLIDTTGKAHR